MNEIEDGVYIHKYHSIAYMVKGDKIFIQTPSDPYWKVSGMRRDNMRLLLDNDLIERKM
ncbi:hypothetical protein BvCmsNSP035_02851 [Escherichia coli]|nr:hypothetical protein BvCmsNSP035_02851 [Escherichia coli]